MHSRTVKGIVNTALRASLAAGALLALPALGQDMLPDGPGKAETTAACSGCHGLGQIVGEHRDAATWATTVTSMINNGAPVADADFDKIVNYLATYYGVGPAPAAPEPGAALPAAPGVAPVPGAPYPAAPGLAPVPGAPLPPAPGAAPVPGAPLPPAAGVAPVPGAPPGAAAAGAVDPATGLPIGPGMAETVAACSGCHGLGQILNEHRDAATWATTVTSMINNGAPVADADFDKVVNYLATYFGTSPAPAQ